MQIGILVCALNASYITMETAERLAAGVTQGETNGARAYEPLQQLLEQLRPRLRRYAEALLHRRLCRRLDASDVVQDAYAQAARHVERFSELSGETLCRELMGITRGRSIDSYRRHVRAERRSVLREVPDRSRSEDSIFPRPRNESVGSSSPEERASRREELQTLQQIMDMLSPSDRELLSLRYLRHWDIAQLADHFHVSRSAITTRQFRAVRRLRDLLEASKKNDTV